MTKNKMAQLMLGSNDAALFLINSDDLLEPLKDGKETQNRITICPLCCLAMLSSLTL